MKHNDQLTFQCMIDYWGECYGFLLAFRLHFPQRLDSSREVSCTLLTLCNQHSILSVMATLLFNTEMIVEAHVQMEECLVPFFLVMW